MSRPAIDRSPARRYVIRHAMLQRNITVTRLAGILNLSIPYTSQLINGHRIAKTQEGKLCQALGIPRHLLQ